MIKHHIYDHLLTSGQVLRGGGGKMKLRYFLPIKYIISSNFVNKIKSIFYIWGKIWFSKWGKKIIIFQIHVSPCCWQYGASLQTFDDTSSEPYPTPTRLTFMGTFSLSNASTNKDKLMNLFFSWNLNQSIM